MLKNALPDQIAPKILRFVHFILITGTILIENGPNKILNFESFNFIILKN